MCADRLALPAIRPLRALLAADVIAEDLDRLAAEQPPDGGWDVDFTVYSPAPALEWRRGHGEGAEDPAECCGD